MVDDDVAEFHVSERRGGRIQFWTNDMYRRTFSDRFEIEDILAAHERDEGEDDRKLAYFSVMIARKRQETGTHVRNDV